MICSTNLHLFDSRISDEPTFPPYKTDGYTSQCRQEGEWNMHMADRTVVRSSRCWAISRCRPGVFFVWSSISRSRRVGCIDLIFFLQSRWMDTKLWCQLAAKMNGHVLYLKLPNTTWPITDFASGLPCFCCRQNREGSALHLLCYGQDLRRMYIIWFDKLNAQVHACNSDSFSHHFGTPLKVSWNRWDGTGFCVKNSSDDHGLCLLPIVGSFSIVNLLYHYPIEWQHSFFGKNHVKLSQPDRK